MEVALITGCSAGIGRGLAEDLNTRKLPDGRKAFKVYATDINAGPLKELEQKGMGIAELDVTSDSSIKAAVDSILKKEGRIDLLVCNAGVGFAGWLTEIPIEDIRRLFAVNVFGVFRCIQAVAPSMMDRRKGKIATVCSLNSWIVQCFGGPYSGSKAALAMMTEALRIEVEPFGIHVSSIVPGWVNSNMVDNSTVRYDIYDAPTSFYHQIMYRVRERKVVNHAGGISIQQAGKEIGDGLSKEKPPRFIHTGGWRYLAMLYAFIQMWISSSFMARQIQKAYHLNLTHKLGRAQRSLPNGANANGTHTDRPTTKKGV